MFSSVVPDLVDQERGEASIRGLPESPRQSDAHEIVPRGPMRAAEANASPAAETSQDLDSVARAAHQTRRSTQAWESNGSSGAQLVGDPFEGRFSGLLPAQDAAHEHAPLDLPPFTPIMGGEASAPRTLPHPSSEPDGVHIQIGRIEVTAVQAAPPQPPKPRRAGMSLDEYLRRRDGRAS
jgi:hypothetical protein